ncbi:hypothetical protein [Burkholderia cenocepacia]|uniref:hypothetical protein n=1 Tax=Burkholderia cenocepacia TaxID=95486 RepID=UPI002AAF2FC9|nr:hypothetical protein [Burkholderia cenocepacia]
MINAASSQRGARVFDAGQDVDAVISEPRVARQVDRALELECATSAVDVGPVMSIPFDGVAMRF